MTEEEKQLKAFEEALNTRNFEIELYWKRSKYFWDIFWATGGLTSILSLIGIYYGRDYFDPNEMSLLYVLLVLVETIGLVAAVAWCLVNEGSKYWQNYWENKVETLEDVISSTMFHNHVPDDKTYPVRYSVSKINQTFSEFAVVIWAIILFITIVFFIFNRAVSLDMEIIAALLIGLFVGIAICVIFIFFRYDKGKGIENKE